MSETKTSFNTPASQETLRETDPTVSVTLATKDKLKPVAQALSPNQA
ncbi:MAG: hypothetical protein WAQ27_05885 [Candidatus Microsaccharimonas sp.]